MTWRMQISEQISLMRIEIRELTTAVNKAIGSSSTANMEKLMGKIDDVKAAVADNKTVTESVVTLLGRLHDDLEAAKGDPAAIDAVIADIKANTESLAAAVVKNTPSAGETDADQHRAGM